MPECSPLDVGAFAGLLSAKVLDSFGGKLNDFPQWRMSFISVFHSKDLPLSFKFMALTNSLSRNAERHMRGALPGPNGYRLIIRRLEEEFGDWSRLINSYERRIRDHGTVRAGALEDLVELVDAVESYHAALPQDQYAAKYSHAHFTEVIRKLERPLRLDYYSYLTVAGRELEPDIDLLLSWLRVAQIGVLRRGWLGTGPSADQLDCPLCV